METHWSREAADSSQEAALLGELGLSDALPQSIPPPVRGPQVSSVSPTLLLTLPAVSS